MSGAPVPEPLAAFRVDGSLDIGTGHVMRCLTLADALAQRGVRCLFLSRALTNPLASRLSDSGHEVIRLAKGGPDPDAADGPYGQWLGTTQAHDADRSVDALGDRRPLALVVDHYGLDAVWERMVVKRTGARMLAIDDLSRSHVADVVVDSTFGKTEADYEGLVGPDCVRLVGAAYASLRPDFARLRTASLERRDRACAQGHPARDIVVSMGGADPEDATGWVLDGLEALAAADGPVRLHALVGAAYPHRERLETRAARLGDVLTIHRDVRDVGALLSEMDLAIGAPGTSAWERCCLGLPSVQIVLADNQRTIARTLSEAGAAIDGGMFRRETDPHDWARRHVASLLEPGALDPLSRSARDVTDGRGVQRVAAALLAPIVREQPLRLRPARMEDAALLYEWQCDPRTRRYAVNPDIPAWDEHKAFMARKLADPTASFHVAIAAGIACGVVRLDVSKSEPPPVPEGTAWREVSILTAPEFYGCGVASRALGALRGAHPGETIVARVLDGNEASQRLFASAGYSPYAANLLMKSGTR